MDPAAQMPILDHLIELRRRLLYAVLTFVGAFILSYPFAEEVFSFLAQPLAEALGKDSGRKLIYTGLTEAFATYVKVSFFCATFIAFPLIANQIWLFIAPGLYQKEKNVVRPFLIATPILFIIGAAFAYYFILPPFLDFCLHYQTSNLAGIKLELEAKINEYLSTIMQLILAFGLGFELPVLLVLLARVGVVGSQGLRRQRKYAFLIIIIAAAILTPPDVLSMLGLACPLYGLYEVSILLVNLLEKKRSKVADL